MGPPSEPGADPVVVHGLLVCRNVERAPDGNLSLREVLEVVPVDAFPADAGPLTFVAFLRHLPPGPVACDFVVRPVGRPDHVTARLPLRTTLGQGFEDRQVALQVRMPSVPVRQGGWYEVALEREGRRLAANRFAIGTRGSV